MKFLNKVTACILCLVLIMNLPTWAYGAEQIDNTDEINSYIIRVISNEYLEPFVTFYEFRGKYYLDFEDIKDFTRCTLTEDDKTITLTHGLREIVIDKSTGHMTDSDIVDQGNITLLEYKDKYLCEGIPMLIYLGAACTIKDGKMLEVLMPTYTIWESIMPDYTDYYYNISELYGGKDNVKICLVCDILADFFDGVSGHGLFTSGDIHLEDALYEVLNVDIMKYESVQELIGAENQKINDFLSSESFNNILNASGNTVDSTYEVLDYYAGFYLNTEILRNEKLWNRRYRSGDLKAASELSSQINKQVYEQSAIKANLKEVKANQKFLDVGMLAFDTATTSYNLMQYDDDTKNLFARTINDEMFEYADYYEISWNNVSDKISNILKNTQSIVANTTVKNVTEFTVEKVTEKSVESALSFFTSKANIYITVAQIGSFVGSLINYNSIQAFSADMNAIWLSTVQYDIAMMVSKLLIKERDEFQLSSTESLEKLKDMFTLYYRTTIAYAENLALSIDEFGGKDRGKSVQYFAGKSGNSVSNYVAKYLYRITNCTIVPVVEYSNLHDNLITSDWINNFRITVEKIKLVSDTYYDTTQEMTYEYATITAYSDTEDIVWSYETPKCMMTEMAAIVELGQRDNYYYFVEDTSVVCIDVQSGTVLWKNDDYAGRATGFAFGENAIYLCGQYGPDFYAISYDGTSLAKIEQFDPQYYWASKIEILIDTAAVYLYGGTENRNIPIVYYVDLKTFKFSKSYNIKCDKPWKNAYIQFINEQESLYNCFDGQHTKIYELVDINGDEIPELYIFSGITSVGDFACTYADDSVQSIWMWTYGFSYLEGENIFMDSGGHMHVYYDIVYSIVNGKITELHRGDYGARDNSQVQFDANGEPIYEYFWDGVEVTKEEYNSQKSNIYNGQEGISPITDDDWNDELGRYVGDGLCTYFEIIETIYNY